MMMPESVLDSGASRKTGEAGPYLAIWERKVGAQSGLGDGAGAPRSIAWQQNEDRRESGDTETERQKHFPRKPVVSWAPKHNKKPQGPWWSWLAGHLRWGMASATATGLSHGRRQRVLLGAGAQGCRGQFVLFSCRFRTTGELHPWFQEHRAEPLLWATDTAR